MRLPVIGRKSNIKSRNISLLGINRADTSGLYDAVNFTGCGRCVTRTPRSAAMFLNEEPDQILPCGERLFFRYGNRLREVFCDENGCLMEEDKFYYLSDFVDDKDRILFFWENSVYVLPDGIRLENETAEWNIFGVGCSVSVALPFVNERTLFYTSGYSGGEFCNDAVNLKLGSKLRFSWASEEFRVVALEEANSISGEAEKIFEGTRVTLDKAVPQYDCFPGGGYMEYASPTDRKTPVNMHIGNNSSVLFSGSSVIFSGFLDGLIYTQDPSTFFKVGQTVRIIGSTLARNNITAKILQMSSDTISFDKDFAYLKEKVGTEIIISPVIPDFDFALITEDRLFGADNKGGKFWISALKEPFLFFDEPVNQSDAWSVNLTQPVTGLTLWKDSVICYTDMGGFRLLGYHALNFGLRQLSVSGIKEGCGGTLSGIGHMLFYNSKRGIMRYAGGYDLKVSEKIAEPKKAEKAVTLGKEYYLLDEGRIYVYDPDAELWWSEDAKGVTDMFCAFKNRYLLKNNTVYLASGGNASVRWSLETNELLPLDGEYMWPISCNIKISPKSRGDVRLFFKQRGDDYFRLLGVKSITEQGRVIFDLPKCKTEGFTLRLEGDGTAEIENIRLNYRQK